MRETTTDRDTSQAVLVRSVGAPMATRRPAIAAMFVSALACLIGVIVAATHMLAPSLDLVQVLIWTLFAVIGGAGLIAGRRYDLALQERQRLALTASRDADELTRR